MENSTNTTREQILHYLSTNQDIYIRILDNLQYERHSSRRLSNHYIYRTILSSITHTENALTNRYFGQRNSFIPSINPWLIPSTTNSTTSPRESGFSYLDNFINSTQTIDISANITFSEWPDYDSVPLDASGVPIPIVNCPITHQEFTTGDRIGRINSCGHIFSEDGIRRWLISNNSCPMCRSRVDASFNYIDANNIRVNE